MKKELFRMERVTYQEYGVTLLENFYLHIDQGEIMGMLPVNAYGLNGFLKLLQTNAPLYDGYVYYAGEMVNSWKEEYRTTNRISIIGAESRLVGNLSVTDNIFVLRQGFRQEIIRERLLARQLQPFLEEMGVELPLDARVKRLTAFQRVLVELLRAVVLGHRLIVIHDVGSLISYEELKTLHQILRRYREKGYTFLYICPHLEEIAMVCGRCAMLSHGRIQNVVYEEELEAEVPRAYTAEYRKMVDSHQRIRGRDGRAGKEILRLEGICGEQLQNLELSVYEGECLAVQLQDDRAFAEAAGMLAGTYRVREGQIHMEGKRTRLRGNCRIAVIQELAARTMIFPELNYMDNLCMALSCRIPSIWRDGGIRESIRREYGPILGEEVFSMPVEELSEKQKLEMIYTRILLQKPRVVFCLQPFKGADLPLRMTIWRQMETLLKHKIAVVIVTVNLSDSLSLAERLIVVGRDGQQEFGRDEFFLVQGNVPWTHVAPDGPQRPEPHGKGASRSDAAGQRKTVCDKRD